MNSKMPLSEWIGGRRAALVLIDMQVDFGAPDGALGKAGLDLTEPAKAMAQSEKLADAARAAGIPCIFVGLQTRKDLDSPAWRERMRRRGGDPDSESGICREGTYGAEFIGPRPLPGELVIGKLRYSGFYGTPLDASLKAKGVDTLVVCGLTTECCVDCTVRDAFHLDYHVFLVRDACAAYERDIHESSLKSLELNCAILVDTKDVVAAWQRGETKIGGSLRHV